MTSSPSDKTSCTPPGRDAPRWWHANASTGAARIQREPHTRYATQARTADLLRASSRRWAGTPSMVRDQLAPAVLLLGSIAPGLAHNGVALGELATRGWNGWAVALIVAQAVPLALSRTRPTIAFWLVAGAFAAFQSLGYEPAFAGLGIFVAIFFLGYGPSRRRSATLGLATVAYVALAAALSAAGSPDGVVDFVTFYLVLVVPCALGIALRARGRAAAELALRNEQRAIQAERRQLARELHDVVSHHVTAMVVQADAGETLTTLSPSDDDSRVRLAFEQIGDSGRRALEDLRELLNVLSDRIPDASLRPQLSGVADLVRAAQQGGQQVDLADGLSPTTASLMSDAAQLAAFRLVQEGLTNARKHAVDQPVRIQLFERDRQVCLVITSSRGDRPSSLARASGSGYGLAGLAERVHLVGGTLASGVEADQFVLRACIPLQDG